MPLTCWQQAPHLPWKVSNGPTTIIYHTMPKSTYTEGARSKICNENKSNFNNNVGEESAKQENYQNLEIILFQPKAKCNKLMRSLRNMRTIQNNVGVLHCLARKPVHRYHQHTKCTTVLNQVQYIFPWLDASALLQYLLAQPNSLNLRLGKPPDHWHDLEVRTKISMMDKRRVILTCCSLLSADMDYSSLELPSSQFGDHFLHLSIRKAIKAFILVVHNYKAIIIPSI